MPELKELEEIRAADGSRVAVRSDAGAEILETIDSRGRLIFEFHPATGRAVLHVPGALDVEAEGAIRLKGKTITLDAEHEMSLSSADSRLQMNPDAMRLDSGEIAFCAKEMKARADRGQAEIREIRFRAERLEQSIGRVILVARELLQRVEGLIHTRAGRVRIQSRRDVTIQTRTANLVAKDDFRVQGETIHLG